MLFSIHDILGENIPEALFIVFNLIIIESLLSVDDAMVVCGFVSQLEKEKQKRALWKVFLGALLLRALMLLFASLLVKIWWLVPLVGIFMMMLSLKILLKKNVTIRTFGILALVYITSGVSNVDSVFAAVAFTDNMYLIYIGILVGLLVMYFVSLLFIRMYIRCTGFHYWMAICLLFLGLRYCLKAVTHYYPDAAFTRIMDSEETDLAFSLLVFAGALAVWFYSYLNKKNTVI